MEDILDLELAKAHEALKYLLETHIELAAKTLCVSKYKIQFTVEFKRLHNKTVVAGKVRYARAPMTDQLELHADTSGVEQIELIGANHWNRD
jgi:hypothetical protein